MHHKGRFSISQFSSYEQNKRTSAYAYVLCQDAWKPVLRKPNDSQSCAWKQACELENVKPSTASSTGVGRKAKRGTAVFLYSISEARHLGDGVILLVGLRNLFLFVFQRPRYSRFAAFLKSRSLSRLHIDLFCVLPQGLSSKTETDGSLGKSHNSRHL